jgi:hypothetical protein
MKNEVHNGVRYCNHDTEFSSSKWIHGKDMSSFDGNINSIKKNTESLEDRENKSWHRWAY